MSDEDAENEQNQRTLQTMETTNCLTSQNQDCSHPHFLITLQELWDENQEPGNI